jgi:CubicO group peptidase (beta-lactamase class C family)
MMQTSRRTLVGALAALAAAGTARAAAAADPVLSQATSGTATPGMAAIVIRGFVAEPERVAGVRRLGSPGLVAPGDRWHLGSDGKAMTATLLARLVERGLLSWDAPLAGMLPPLAPAMRPEYRDVTLTDLLTHRAGLPENHDDTPFFNSFYADKATPTAQRLRYITAALGDAPIGPHSAGGSYSNTGLLIAAAIAEHATGKAFETLIAAEVFRPLGMSSFSFDQYGGPGEPCGHVDGRVADRLLDPNPRMFAPAGAMRFSLADWARFCIEHMRGEAGRGRLLKAPTYRYLHTGRGAADRPIWAMGWGAAPAAVGRKGPALTHAGSDGNWNAVVVLFPARGEGVLVATNSAEGMGGDKASVAALRALAATVSDPV